jgi:hypothetical protein
MTTINYTRKVAVQLTKAVEEFRMANDRFEKRDRLHALENQLAEIKYHGRHLRNAASGAYQAYLLQAGYPKVMGQIQQLKFELNTEGV